ncbi:DUF3375 domain-containing protein [Gulosibacter molinativorax]|uniref:DUF3375 domain-containing protein n=1 Tax=Gulosibacter molinativorax TaxID=256821 RepID=A0ABT7CB77_9MICO|nr:DUF3375 domain-containing protein [Gulosibacter molinativorax]MDJ1371896.1 DUF3375 domain-containing protein [Gulosibacter molinativorax]QUY62545.1 Uncharacterized protein GMOLON4_1845 [Gulosibacter molinativorax]
MEIEDLTTLRDQHPAWRLLRAQNAPLVLSFLGEQFVEQNQGAIPMGRLVDALDEHLYKIRQSDPEAYPRDPENYLDDWADPQQGWLRKFYPVDSDEVHYDATPAIEKAVQWVQSLQQRSFVGTESRLHTLIELLRQIVHGTETDPDARIAELERRRSQIDEEIEAVRENRAVLLDETSVRDRYQLFASTARELLSDFREVEENFRGLDRSARERIAGWDGSKGELLGELVSSRTDISSSDQGRSFQAFYDFLLSEQRQLELTDLIESVQSMPAVHADRRLRLVHHDWAEAAERTQQTVRSLSEQLRRFLEDQVWLENRRVLDLVRTVEQAAIRVRSNPPEELGIVIDEPGLTIELPFERPLYSPQPDSVIDSLIAPEEDSEGDYDALFGQRFVDSARLVENIRSIVPRRSVAELSDIIELYPVEEGIAEILGYLALSEDDIDIALDDEVTTVIDYTDLAGMPKRVTLPKVSVARR